MVPEGGLEPPHSQGASDFESDASTNSTTPALVLVYYQSSPGFASEDPGFQASVRTVETEAPQRVKFIYCSQNSA